MVSMRSSSEMEVFDLFDFPFLSFLYGAPLVKLLSAVAVPPDIEKSPRQQYRRRFHCTCSKIHFLAFPAEILQDQICGVDVLKIYILLDMQSTLHRDPWSYCVQYNNALPVSLLRKERHDIPLSRFRTRLPLGWHSNGWFLLRRGCGFIL